MGLRMALGWSVNHFGPVLFILTIIRWFYRLDRLLNLMDAFMFLRINCDRFGDNLIYHLAQSTGQDFNLPHTLVYDQIPANILQFKLVAVILCSELMGKY